MAKQARRDVRRHSSSDLARVNRDLMRFAETTKILSSKRPRLIEKYPNQWICVYNGDVVANADSLKALMTRLDEMGVPSENTIVRYIDKEERTLIL